MLTAYKQDAYPDIMRINARSSKLVSWVAIIAVAFQVFWPLMANAQPGKQAWVEICSVQGVQKVAIDLDGGDSSPKPDAGHLKPHCALCSFSADRLAVPVFQFVFLLPPDGPTYGPPPKATHLALPSAEYLSARPRAPPYYS